MPDGRVSRIDEDDGRVYIVRRGRLYVADLAAVEPAARVASARVTFSRRREGGTERAENVRLRVGTRTNKRQRRFGDLTGARRPGAKVPTAAHAEFGIDVTTQPFKVARAWAEAMADGDLDAVSTLYRPQSVVHTASGPVSGRRHIHAVLERSPWFDRSGRGFELVGNDASVRIDLDGESTYVEVDRGAIAEQWLGVEPVDDEAPDPEGHVQVVAKGEVANGALDYAERKVDHLLDSLDDAGVSAEVKLSQVVDASADRPAMVQMTLDLDGQPLRVRAGAPTMTEAVDVAIGRLKARLGRQRDRQRHNPTRRPPTPGGWQHGNLRSDAPSYFDRPIEERELVRHKSFAPGEMTVDEAASDMALMDYDFFLFVELSTGADCLLEREAGPDLSVRCVRGANEMVVADSDSGFIVGTAPVPSLPVKEAMDVLDQTGARHLFFENATSRRGNVIYRRYDGHYGLITPPAG